MRTRKGAREREGEREIERRRPNNDRNQFIDRVKRARQREKEPMHISPFKEEEREKERRQGKREKENRLKPNLLAFRLKIFIFHMK